MSKVLFIFIFLFTSIVTASNNEDQKLYYSSKRILGRIESVGVEGKIILDAKLDTGSDMSSLSASNIKIINANHKKWVMFFMIDPSTHHKILITKPLIGFVTIRKRSDESDPNFFKKNKQARPVVILTISLGNKTYLIKTNLINRSHFRYPMLLGAEAIRKFNAVIDVTEDHVVTRKRNLISCET